MAAAGRPRFVRPPGQRARFGGGGGGGGSHRGPVAAARVRKHPNRII